MIRGYEIIHGVEVVYSQRELLFPEISEWTKGESSLLNVQLTCGTHYHKV